MTFVRPRLIVCALAVLLCQTASPIVAPFALCRGGASAMADEDDCCKGMAPGQTCPMHHKTAPRPGDAGLRCTCGVSDVALTALVGAAGFVARTVTVSAPLVESTVVAPVVPSAPDYRRPPDLPPPRS